VRAEAARREDVILISALAGEGMDDLLGCASAKLSKGAKLSTVTLRASDGESIAWLHANGRIESQRTDGIETVFEVRLSDADWARLQSRQRV
jgi:GTPase